ncbi:het-s domain protein [Seiridium cupressi]
MESFLPLGGFQLPFQRRLSRLYNDTKKSSDFVKEPVSEDPEIKAMHRKLKIQKDRLVSWGLEWSDPSNQNAEIDESLSKAGLSDLVGSIMSTIKDILAEAEPLWLSSKRRVTSEKEPERGTGDKKIPIVVWDKTRFEDLIKDLTASIDTLHDLSRTRSTAAMSARAARSTRSTEEFRPFGSTRIQTPQQIDPRTLTNIKSMQAQPMSSPVPGGSRPQEVAFMSKQAYSDLTHRAGRQPWSPLLLEYAHFDPIYSTTGIMPTMSRFEKLSTGLQTESHRSPGAWIGLPLLLGYYEDMENSRLGLVYQFPATFNPVTFENLTQNPIDNLCTLGDLLSRPGFEPRLEAKFRLAHNLANTVFDMHARGITHGNLLETTISFCSAVGNEAGIAMEEVDIRKPLVSSFDLFAEEGPQILSTSTTLHRHPLDPRTTSHSPLVSNRDSKTLDLYSLAMLLVSIGLWTRLENLIPNSSSPSVPESVLEQVAIQCGTLYMRAVQVCWNAVEQELARPGSSDEILSQVQIRASRYLEACSILDGVSGLDDRISEDIGDVPTGERERQPSLAISMSSLAGPSAEGKQARSTTTTPVIPERKYEIPRVPVAAARDEKPDLGLQKVEPSKLRLYPQIPLPPEAVEQWNRVVMPQINMALRHFCRKHPESVEITLESIGESPHKTTPTVLVVCTSVSKVRTILRKKLGAFFDDTTGFGLKVCRGSVVRSRKGETTRSMAPGRHSTGEGQDESGAANPGFQVRPQNGASIGAWIGDRHLPPVSFGGLITVNDKTYGMTVHHMLDDQEEMRQHSLDPGMTTPPMRSSAAAQDFSYLEAESLDDSSGSEDYACEFSDTESDYSATDITSDVEEGEEEGEYEEDGDIPGVEPGCGEGYIITQPAFDDVDEGFYPSEETENEDHLDTYRLGEVFATSGICRRYESNGYVHEIDWALFEFEEQRFPENNRVPRLKLPDQSPGPPAVHFQPTAIAYADELPGLEVQCSARTSGLQTGKILPAIASIKVYGRTSMSHTYQVSSKASTNSVPALGPLSSSAINTRTIPGVSLGIPGDSGAWIIDRRKGQLCGHVLAFSHRKQVAYISPIDILIKDIAETLDASEVRLGGECVFERSAGRAEGKLGSDDEDLSDLLEDDDDGNDADEAQQQLARGMRALTSDMDRMQLKTGVVS